MNKYYPVIARAVERLDGSTGETRRAVYERARKAVAQLRSNQPALLEADMTKESLALEEAILKVEAEAACCLGSETGAEARSPASAVSISYDDKVQSRDDGQSVSLDQDDRQQPLSSRQAPIFFSASNERDSVDIQAVEIGGAYGADHYHDEAPSSRWRGGFLVVMAALVLAVLAGTFAYHGMFGGDMTDTIRNDSARRSNSSETYTTSSSEEPLQPDIREARKTPRVISAIPISSTLSAGAGPAPAAPAPALGPSSDVDRQVAATLPPPAAAPVPVQAPSEPDETAALGPAAPASGLAPVSAAVPPPAAVLVAAASSKTAAPAPAAPTPSLEPPVRAANFPPPAAASTPVPDSPPPETAAAPAAREQGEPLVLTAATVPPIASALVPALGSAEPNETAELHSSEPTETAAAASAAHTPALGPSVLTAAASPPAAAAPTPVKPSSDAKKIDLVTVEDGLGETDTSSSPAPAPNTVIPAPVTSAAAAPPSGNHDPQEEVAPTPSSSSPEAGKDTAAEVSPGGAYAVQLASERSAAEAQASFRALRSKFPNQLGGHEPIVRRTDLGAKGVYYRLMVGRFASMEKAAGMCGTLKAAGCKCLVQRN